MDPNAPNLPPTGEASAPTVSAIDVRSDIDAAEKSAAAGDYAEAERFLRRAALKQEADLGSSHPDLANTLNNLGVVCEIAEKPTDAEQFFRRAYAIATLTLPPDHPFVSTSRQNLEDFCKARGIAPPAALPAPPPPISVMRATPPTTASLPASASPPVAADADLKPELQDSRVPGVAVVPMPVPGVKASRPAPEKSSAAVKNAATSAKKSPATAGDTRAPADEPRGIEAAPPRRPLGMGAVIAGGLLIAVAAASIWRGSDREAGPPTAMQGASSSVAPTTASAARPDAPPATADPPMSAQPGANAAATPPMDATSQAVSPAIASPAAPGVSRSSAESAAAVATPSATPAPAAVESAGTLQVVTAQLCSSMPSGSSRGSNGEWRCTAPSNPVAPGSVVFYTRVKSPTNTTIQHRWYRDDRLIRAVDLAIRANPTEGYRTFSRNTVGGQGRGEWKVELVAKDGVVLHEERFVVR
ncbi:MAG: DUF2914 domain-containing protein [Acidobacteriota bacterium]